MIKLIPHRNISKRDLFKAVESGRKFGVFKGDESAYMPEIHWDDNYGNNPIRCGTKPWNWRGFKYLHEITEPHWYDNIPEGGVLCWVSNTSKSAKDQIRYIAQHSNDYPSNFATKNIERWVYATPVLPSECYQEPV